MKALVTGSAGFVGRHMAAELIARGWDVVCVDPEHHFGMVPGAQATRSSDIRLWFARQELPPGERDGVDLVVHCAAVVGGRAMIDAQPLLLAAEDLSIDAELFRWLLRQDSPPKVVYFSSSAAYPTAFQLAPPSDGDDGLQGRLREHDIDLNRPMLPDATYGWVKLTGERLAAEAVKMGLPVYVFRPFSGYGSDQHLDYPFPSFIDRALRREDPFDIWGPGTQVRDWVHIDDVVGCVLARLEGDDTAPVNIGTGVATSFVQLAAAVVDQVPGYDPRIEVHPDKPTGVMYRVADCTRMRAFYEPTVSLAEGIRRALDR